MACITTQALRTEAGVIRSLGRGEPPIAISVARLPLASAMRWRSAWVAGAVADIGSERPSASITQAIVLAVPITPHVPTVGQRRPLTSSISAASTEPARCCAQKRRQSVQAPRTSPR
jgi:hypothetical protein